jgi:hypothetical protein
MRFFKDDMQTASKSRTWSRIKSSISKIRKRPTTIKKHLNIDHEVSIVGESDAIDLTPSAVAPVAQPARLTTEKTGESLRSIDDRSFTLTPHPEAENQNGDMKPVVDDLQRSRYPTVDDVILVAKKRNSKSNGRPSFVDEDFLRISEYLERVGWEWWSLRPRLFTLLQLITQNPRSIDLEPESFSHLTDSDIPVPVKVLRPYTQLDSETLDPIQDSLTTVLDELEKSGGEHLVIEGSSNDYFRSLGNLGQGRYSKVEKVQSRLSLKHYALKKIRLGDISYSSPQSLANEINILKQLSHRHLVKLIGSFTDVGFIALLQFPVASMDLGGFFNSNGILPSIEYNKVLRSFYGCLANALAFLHHNRIRHKDIKPANILVKELKVYLTDFGLATQWTEDALSHNTKETAGEFTPTYAAPEVVDNLVLVSASRFKTNTFGLRFIASWYRKRYLVIRLRFSRDDDSVVWSLNHRYLGIP